MAQSEHHQREPINRRRPIGAASLDLYDYARPSAPRAGRPPKHDLSTWTVTDDWPEHVPITAAEVYAFEAWFGDLFDDLFGPCR